MIVDIKSRGCLSEKDYDGHPRSNWWVRIGEGETSSWITLDPPRPGNALLDVTVDVPDGVSELTIGCGPPILGTWEKIPTKPSSR